MYLQNSRNDLNETLTKVTFESLIQPVLVPERLVLEHTMLIAALHANVGTEVGKININYNKYLIIFIAAIFCFLINFKNLSDFI